MCIDILEIPFYSANSLVCSQVGLAAPSFYISDYNLTREWTSCLGEESGLSAGLDETSNTAFACSSSFQ